MIKRFTRINFIQSVLSWIISVYLKLCYHTSFWCVKDESRVRDLIKKNNKVIICFWHGNLLMTPYCWNFDKYFYMLISPHPDGRLISKAVSYFQINTISGSSSKNSLSSTKKIIKLIEKNHVIGITPDGPRGPRKEVKKSISSLAKLTNSIILPLSVSAKYEYNFNSWDKFSFVFPFNKFAIVWGNPIYWDNKKKLYMHTDDVQNELNRVSKLSRTFVG